jgi:hypothetical protein
MSPAGKEVTTLSTDICRLADGKIVEQRFEADFTSAAGQE